MYREIYIHVFTIIEQPTYRILSSVLCSKMKQYWLKFHASGQRWIRVEPRGMVQPITHNLVNRKQDGSTHVTWYTKVKVSNFFWSMWYGSANRSGNDVNKMAAPFCVLLLFINTLDFLHTLKEYEIIKLIYNRKSCSLGLLSLCTWGYISLGDPTWQQEVWRKILLNTNSCYLTEAFESMHTLFLLTKSAAAHLFHWY